MPEFPDSGFIDMIQAQARAHANGSSRDATKRSTREAPDVESLRRWLIEHTSSLRPDDAQEKRAMPLTLEATPVPLRVDELGVYRLGKSRVVLDIVIRAFNSGASPEAIADAYDTLDVADVYAIVAYYLRHRDEADRHIRGRAEQAEGLRRSIEAKQGGSGDLRATLLSRRAARKQEHVATSNR